jgi:hypothetical protein
MRTAGVRLCIAKVDRADEFPPRPARHPKLLSQSLDTLWRPFVFHTMRFPDALLSLLLILAILPRPNLISMYRRKRKRGRTSRRPPATAPSPPTTHGFPSRKPEWIRRAVLHFHESHPEWSHRKLADVFNQHHRAEGFSVGRTWVRELCKRQAYEALHR